MRRRAEKIYPKRVGSLRAQRPHNGYGDGLATYELRRPMADAAQCGGASSFVSNGASIEAVAQRFIFAVERLGISEVVR